MAARVNPSNPPGTFMSMVTLPRGRHYTQNKIDTLIGFQDEFEIIN